MQRWADKVEQMVDDGASPTAIYDKLRLEEETFNGSLSAIKRLCQRIKRAKGVHPYRLQFPPTGMARSHR